MKMLRQWILSGFVLISLVGPGRADPLGPCGGCQGGECPTGSLPAERIFVIDDAGGPGQNPDRGGYYNGTTIQADQDPRAMRRQGWRFYRGRWVRWVVGRIDREDPRNEDNWSDLLDEARDQALDALAEAADVVPVVNTVKLALEHALSTADSRDVYVTYLLVDEKGQVLGQEVVQLQGADEVPFYNDHMPASERRDVLAKGARALDARMARGWTPSP